MWAGHKWVNPVPVAAYGGRPEIYHYVNQAHVGKIASKYTYHNGRISWFIVRGNVIIWHNESNWFSQKFEVRWGERACKITGVVHCVELFSFGRFNLSIKSWRGWDNWVGESWDIVNDFGCKKCFRVGSIARPHNRKLTGVEISAERQVDWALDQLCKGFKEGERVIIRWINNKFTRLRKERYLECFGRLKFLERVRFYSVDIKSWNLVNVRTGFEVILRGFNGQSWFSSKKWWIGWSKWRVKSFALTIRGRRA